MVEHFHEHLLARYLEECPQAKDPRKTMAQTPVIAHAQKARFGRNNTQWTLQYFDAQASLSHRICPCQTRGPLFGYPVPSMKNLSIGALPLPAKPVFAIGMAFFEIQDPNEHRRTVEDLRSVVTRH